MVTSMEHPGVLTLNISANTLVFTALAAPGGFWGFWKLVKPSPSHEIVCQGITLEPVICQLRFS